MFQRLFHSAFHACFHSLIPAALVLTADFLFLQVSIFTMNIKTACRGKLNSKAFNVAFLSASFLLLFSLSSTTVCLFVCHFPNQKSRKKRENTCGISTPIF